MKSKHVNKCLFFESNCVNKSHLMTSPTCWGLKEFPQESQAVSRGSEDPSGSSDPEHEGLSEAAPGGQGHRDLYDSPEGSSGNSRYRYRGAAGAPRGHRTAPPAGHWKVSSRGRNSELPSLLPVWVLLDAPHTHSFRSTTRSEGEALQVEAGGV